MKDSSSAGDGKIDTALCGRRNCSEAMWRRACATSSGSKEKDARRFKKQGDSEPFPRSIFYRRKQMWSDVTLPRNTLKNCDKLQYSRKQN
jgi:hypothetical protein